MAYILNTPVEQRAMLDVIGVNSIAELIDAQIPKAVQLDRPLNLPEPLGEMALEQAVRALASRNQTGRVCLIGGGAYDHFIPAVVDEITSRGEFYTAYTPYQAEASQGSLQAFFEYQSLICRLTGMDVSNASLYEGGTAVSEAAFMAMRQTNRHAKIVVLGTVNPQYRSVLKTYLHELNCEIVTVPHLNGVVDLKALGEAVDDRTAGVIFQHPNAFGCLEPAAEICAAAKQHGALAIASIDPISLGLLKRPAEYGADIVVAEGQPLGIPLQYGGPYLGVLACRTEFVRRMPGRLIAQTVDRDGRPCYVLGLQTREQHIRRDKATSNICTNQGLLALRATVYLSALGPHGLREAAELCLQKSNYLAEQLQSVNGLSIAFSQPFFKEFVVRSTHPTHEVLQAARHSGFDIGPELSTLGQEDMNDCLLVAVTEKRTREELDSLVAVLRHRFG